MAKKEKQKIGPWQDAWLRTLESGKFLQGAHRLAKQDGCNWRFCCLGLACEVATENGFKLKTNITKDGDANSAGMICTYQKNGYEAVGVSALPSSVRDLFGFRDTLGKPLRGSSNLAALNDEGKTFEQIAAIVRANPAKYFTEPK